VRSHPRFGAWLACIVAVWGVLFAAPAGVRAFPSAAALRAEAPEAAPAAAQPAHEGAAEPGEGEGHEGGGLLPVLARLLNFAVLVGGLGYLLRKPLADYLQKRATLIRRDLNDAEAMQEAARVEMADIEAKLSALPAELEGLKARGAEEVAAESRRIRQLADAERGRVLEQTRREIDQQVRAARDTLRREAATLATEVAARRIRESLTSDDHLRLVDRYAAEVSTLGPEEAGRTGAAPQ
jgi:F-type H+-transporting ATPase subunit b